MKICWDNLEGFRKTRSGNLYNKEKRCTLFILICKTCNEEFLNTYKGTKFCNQKCKRFTKDTRKKMSLAKLGKSTWNLMSYEYIKENIEQKGYILLSTTYKNSNTKLKIKCKNGHIFKMDWNHFNRSDRKGDCILCHSRSEEDNKNYKINWNKNNKERAKQQEKERRNTKIGREKYREARRKYKIQKRGQIPELSSDEIQQINFYYKFARFLKYFGPFFGYNWEVDHIIPLSKGGLHHPANLQLLPKKENARKGAKLNYITNKSKTVTLGHLYA